MKKILIMSAVAVCVSSNSFGVNMVCADCYKCVRYSGASCVQCEYDENYCAVDEHACQAPQTWCAGKNQCTCPALCPDSMEACMGTVNTLTCECEAGAIEIMCMSGQYRSGRVCVDCPTYTGATTSCTPDSTGDDDITSCYYPNGCEFTDIPGTFVLTRDCNYSMNAQESSSSGSSDISGIEIGGGEIAEPLLP
ncbi:MAG: hypothetical protein NC311_03300 [Muribaculaceae bacterium]|nr:hypothetical protein [Muribaculaceae bacterium]